MADITINYKGDAIATMDASGTKTLETEGKYCEDDIEVVYVKPGGGGGTDIDDFINDSWPSGAVVADEATTIPNYRFLGCSAITSFSSSSVTAVGLSTNADGRSFLNCTGLTSVSLPNCTYIADRSFQGCTSLVSVNLPSLTSAGRSGDAHYFDGCANLQLLHLPELTIANGVGPFWGIGSTSKLAVIVLPKITTLGGSPFRSSRCSAVDIGPLLTALPNTAFYSGTYEKIILRSPTLVTAGNSDALYSVGNGTTVYIPKALYDHLGDGTSSDYKAATNWSAKASAITWAQIEGSIYETQYADGTPIPTS